MIRWGIYMRGDSDFRLVCSVTHEYYYRDWVRVDLHCHACATWEVKSIRFLDWGRYEMNKHDPGCTRRVARNIRTACKGEEITFDLVKGVVETMLALEGWT